MKTKNTKTRTSIRNCKSNFYGYVKFNKFYFLIAALMLALFSRTAFPAEPAWPTTKYGVFSKGEPLSDVLKNFSYNYGLQAIVSEKLTDKVNGSVSEQPADSFLQELNERYPFTWYFDGSVMYFYATSEMENKVISLQVIEPTQLKELLVRMEIWDNRFFWKELSEEGVIYVSGPPRLIQLIEQAVFNLDRDQSQSRGEYGVRIFPLKYVSANDKLGSGIVSLLRRLMIAPMTSDQSESPMVSGKMNGMKGKGMAKSPTANKEDHLPQVNLLDPIEEPASPRTEKKIPQMGLSASIEADPRMNTIIIYDKMERMPMYGQVIQELDKPAGQIEIEVTVMNVSTSHINNLGVSWRIASDSASVGMGSFSSDLSAGELGIALGQSDLSSVVSDESALLARIQALEEKGKANILSRPIVVTGNNLEAVIDSTTTFYVRVAGQEEVDLFPVSVGAVLRVTPQIVSERDVMRVTMKVHIEDGQQNSGSVDAIPTVSNARIITQATVNNNESLLLGGYYHDEKIKSEMRVPVLHRVPLLGRLFKTKTTEIVKMSRLFMIRPKIIDIGAVGQSG